VPGFSDISPTIELHSVAVTMLVCLEEPALAMAYQVHMPRLAITAMPWRKSQIY
jgi:hypothetical protein